AKHDRLKFRKKGANFFDSFGGVTQLPFRLLPFSGLSFLCWSFCMAASDPFVDYFIQPFLTLLLGLCHFRIQEFEIFLKLLFLGGQVDFSCTFNCGLII
ncbi:MAG: hypothetical protein PXY39_03025, partial [archaeon]|nr:hypothetical protein [archaeon]